MPNQANDQARRRLFKRVVAGGVTTLAISVVPDKWIKPVVKATVLPVHAQSSPTRTGSAAACTDVLSVGDILVPIRCEEVDLYRTISVDDSSGCRVLTVSPETTVNPGLSANTVREIFFMIPQPGAAVFWSQGVQAQSALGPVNGTSPVTATGTGPSDCSPPAPGVSASPAVVDIVSTPGGNSEQVSMVLTASPSGASVTSINLL